MNSDHKYLIYFSLFDHLAYKTLLNSFTCFVLYTPVDALTEKSISVQYCGTSTLNSFLFSNVLHQVPSLKPVSLTHKMCHIIIIKFNTIQQLTNIFFFFFFIKIKIKNIQFKLFRRNYFFYIT